MQPNERLSDDGELGAAQAAERERERATLNVNFPTLLDLNDIVGYVFEFPSTAAKVGKKRGGNEDE